MQQARIEETPAASHGQPSARILGGGGPRLWGMTAAERLLRSLRRAGVAVIAADLETAAAPPTQQVVLVNADWVFDDGLVGDLVKSPGTVMVAASGVPVAAHVPAGDAARIGALILRDAPLAPGEAGTLRVAGAGDLRGSYDHALRKREPPYLLRLTDAALPEIERRMFAGSYKGVTDLVTKYVWPVPARHVTKWCAQAGITANQVTLLSLILVVITFVLFWKGYFLAGLATACVMTFLDTVDGKLARVTLTSSKFGNVFDHGIDLVHPPFWWWAWIVGLGPAAGNVLPADVTLLLVTVGYVAQRIEEGIFAWLFGMHIHVWRHFDSVFRLITARRNPNLILLTLGALLGRPDLGIAAVAVWTALSFLVHAVRLVQAFAARRHGPITSWLAG